MFFTKLSLAAVATLAAVSEARHEFGLLHPKRSFNTGVPSSTVTVFPAPLSTDPAAATLPGNQPAPTSDLTLTYTIGTGTQTSVVTTTVHHTATSITYVTPTPVGDDNTGGSKPSDNDDGSDPSDNDDGSQPSATSAHPVSTQTINIVPASSNAASATSGGVSPTGEACNAQSTVTVTVGKETVTVTAPSLAEPTGGFDVVSHDGHAATETAPAPAETAPTNPEGANTATVATAAPTETSALKYPPSPSGQTSGAPSVAPYPSTEIILPPATSSGFLTSTKPVPTGRPVPTGFY